jgi:ferredoxin
MPQVRIDRNRCIGAGNCITIAPTAFDWLKDELPKADIVEPTSGLTLKGISEPMDIVSVKWR